MKKPEIQVNLYPIPHVRLGNSIDAALLATAVTEERALVDAQVVLKAALQEIEHKITKLRYGPHS